MPCTSWANAPKANFQFTLSQYIVRDQPERLYRRLCHIKRDKETYYRLRSKPQTSLGPETRALRFLYLNRNCCRVVMPPSGTLKP